jgi:glycosyltransferase involved in cell wall biosynthesis
MPTSARLPTLAVIGVIRNGARFLARELARLRVATAGFERVQVLLVESDSTDDTLAVLAQAAADWPTLRYLSEGSLRERLPQRTARIAHCRNVCLDELARNPLYAEVSHVVVADLDRVCHDLTPAALASCWGPQAPAEWSVCAANQGDWYYDLWALRHPVWCPGDVWQEHAQLLPLLGPTEATNVTQFARMVHIAPDRPWIEVHSAFGGLAVYRRDALLAARYVGLDAEGREVCEHVTLHAQIRATGGHIFINPALINARRTKHGGRKGFWRTQRRRLWNWLRGRSA